MNLLLDTHALIWFSENSPNLSNAAKNAIEAAEHTKYVSTATFWEIAIKQSLGKLHLSSPLSAIVQAIETSEIVILPVLTAHTLRIEFLPLLHRDPFDRMLIAQALTEDFTIISKERLFDGYGVHRVW